MADDTPKVFWVLRYVPPKTIGEGEIVGVVGASEMSIARWRDFDPGKFDKPGFYTLMVSTGETLTVEPPKEEKK